MNTKQQIKKNKAEAKELCQEFDDLINIDDNNQEQYFSKQQNEDDGKFIKYQQPIQLKVNSLEEQDNKDFQNLNNKITALVQKPDRILGPIKFLDFSRLFNKIDFGEYDKSVHKIQSIQNISDQELAQNNENQFTSIRTQVYQLYNEDILFKEQLMKVEKETNNQKIKDEKEINNNQKQEQNILNKSDIQNENNNIQQKIEQIIPDNQIVQIDQPSITKNNISDQNQLSIISIQPNSKQNFLNIQDYQNKHKRPKLDFFTVTIDSDGNCFYKSIAYLLFRNRQDTNQISQFLRESTCQELLVHKYYYEEFTDFIIEGGYSNYDHFVKQQMKLGEWAINSCIYACAKITQKAIIIYEDRGDKKEYTFINTIQPEIYDGKLFILRVDKNQYNALVPKLSSEQDYFQDNVKKMIQNGESLSKKCHAQLTEEEQKELKQVQKFIKKQQEDLYETSKIEQYIPKFNNILIEHRNQYPQASFPANPNRYNEVYRYFAYDEKKTFSNNNSLKSWISLIKKSFIFERGILYFQVSDIQKEFYKKCQNNVKKIELQLKKNMNKKDDSQENEQKDEKDDNEGIYARIPTIDDLQELWYKFHFPLHSCSSIVEQEIRNSGYLFHGLGPWTEQQYKECYSCQITKGGSKVVINEPIVQIIADYPDHMWIVDTQDLNKELHCVINQKTKEKILYSLEFIDQFSKYCYGFLLSNKSSETTAKALQSAMNQFNRRPTKILVDHGTEFKGDFQKLAKENNVEISRGKGYDPKRQGTVERLHRVVHSSLSKQKLDDQQYGRPFSLSHAYEKIIDGIRDRIHSTTKFKPIQLYFLDLKNQDDQILIQTAIINTKNAKISRKGQIILAKEDKILISNQVEPKIKTQYLQSKKSHDKKKIIHQFCIPAIVIAVFQTQCQVKISKKINEDIQEGSIWTVKYQNVRLNSVEIWEKAVKQEPGTQFQQEQSEQSNDEDYYFEDHNDLLPDFIEFL